MKITFTYLQVLDTSMGDFWRLSLYTTLGPRYTMRNIPEKEIHEVLIEE